VNNISFIISD